MCTHKRFRFWSESLQDAFWITKDATLRHADNDDSDQSARIPFLDSFIYIFGVSGKLCYRDCGLS